MSESNEVRDGAVEFNMGHGTDFDDIETAERAGEQLDYSKIKLEGDEVPQFVRGKTVAEALESVNRLTDALRISEDARKALSASHEALGEARNRAAPIAPAPPPPAEDPELSAEDFKKLYEEDPFAAFDARMQQVERRMLKTVQSSIRPIAGTAVQIAKRAAQTQYPDEFAALGKEIEDILEKIPDPSALAAPGAIDDVINYARGKHWKKFSEHLANKGRDEALETERAAFRRETPQDFSLSDTTPPKNQRKGGGPDLDDTERMIADALGVTHDEYARQKPTTRGRNG